MSDERFTANAALLLIDHQVGTMGWVKSAIAMSLRVSRGSPSSAETNSADAASTRFDRAIHPFDHTGDGRRNLCGIMSTGHVRQFSSDATSLLHGRTRAVVAAR